MADFTLKKGDRLPSIISTLRERDGMAADLSGIDSVRFSMTLTTDRSVVKGGSAVAIGGGRVQYHWGASDTNTPGVYRGEFIVVVGGLDKTYPNGGYNSIEVMDDCE